MSDESDSQIWQRVLSGDARAFGLLFDRHRDRVFRHVRRDVESAADAEDLTATAFLELWRLRRSARIVDDSLLPWLLVTAGNVTRNATRARRRYRLFLARLPEPEHAADGTVAAADALDLRADVARLRAHLDALPVADQRLLALTALEGFSLREASEAVGISYGAAKMRMSRVRSRLGAALPDLHPNPRTHTLPTTENGASS